ncbi:hypothetical protein C5N14_07740 [Micromonospora sp. MW-13]|nr:hypothetical protein C5N14_07740 [Micromonospora sp. MW-13]
MPDRRHPGSCRRRSPPVEGNEPGPSWTAGKAVLDHSADSGAGTAAGAIESRRDVARISGRKAAQHLRGRVQRSGRKAALACSTKARVAPGTDTSTRRESGAGADPAGLPACQPVWEDFLYVYQGGPERAARAATRARARRSADAPTPVTQHARRLARTAGSPVGRRMTTGRFPVGVVGRQPAGPRGRHPRGVGERRRVRRRPAGWLAGLRLLRLRRGRSGSRMAGGPSAARGPWVVAVGSHPARRRPGRAEQTTARPASVRTSRQGRLDWRAGRRPAPHGVRVDGRRDGTAASMVITATRVGSALD